MWKLKVLLQFVLSIIPGRVFLNTQFHKLKITSNGYSVESLSGLIPVLNTRLMKINDITPIKGAVIVEVGPGRLHGLRFSNVSAWCKKSA